MQNKCFIYTAIIYFSWRWTKGKLSESWQQDSQTHVEYLICGTLLSIMNLRSNNWRLIVWPCLSAQQAKEWYKVGRRVQITWLHLTIGPAGGGWGYSDCQFDIVPTFPLFSYFERQCVLTYYNWKFKSQKKNKIVQIQIRDSGAEDEWGYSSCQIFRCFLLLTWHTISIPDICNFFYTGSIF